MKNSLKKQEKKQIVGTTLAVFFYGCILAFQLLYLKPTILGILFVFVTFIVAWSVRGVWQETKDTMLSGMGLVELSCLKARIEERIEVLKNENVE
jgi:hypothetical protein